MLYSPRPTNPPPSAAVYLVGAGPGDPDLLTLKALRLIQSADIIVYDRLVGEGILALIPEETPRLYVGKAASRHTMPQDEINRLLVDAARRHRVVVRLKGGDPFIFGRGGEEAEVLKQHGIACEVVPGITSAAGCGAAIGIPLTHRGLATSVTFITGHRREDAADETDWRRYADPDNTLVIYMGLAAAPVIAAGLMAGGLAPDWPAAVIANGTTGHQRNVITTLDDLAPAIARNAIASPALIIIGAVVNLAGLTDTMLAGDAIAWLASASAPAVESHA